MTRRSISLGPKAPCSGCPDRHEGCHDPECCDRWKTFCEQWSEYIIKNEGEKDESD